MKADLICLALLNAFGILQFLPFLRLPQHLMDAYGPWIVGGYCVLIFLLDPMIQSSRLHSRSARYFWWLGRLLLVFLLSVSLWIIVGFMVASHRPRVVGPWSFLYDLSCVAPRTSSIYGRFYRTSVFHRCRLTRRCSQPLAVVLPRRLIERKATPVSSRIALKPRSAAVRSRCASSAPPTSALRAERMTYMRRTFGCAVWKRPLDALQVLGGRCVLPDS